MRLYTKLAVLVALAALLQLAIPQVLSGMWEARFAARCWLASKTHDQVLLEQLIQEAHSRMRAHIPDAVRLRMACEAPPGFNEWECPRPPEAQDQESVATEHYAE